MLLLLGLVGAIACNDSGPGGGVPPGVTGTSRYTPAQAQAICDSAISHLQSCKVLSQGETGCTEGFTDKDACVARCFMAASCTELNTAYCNAANSGEDPDPSTPLGACMLKCDPQLACGDGQTVDADAKCDGWEDCDNGADEAGCAAELCADGSLVDPGSKCDFQQDCADGSDEQGCPAFACEDGSLVDEGAQCDGFEECSDGSDEAGCPTFSCTSGETISASSRCNRDDDCADGSDEVGCPARAQILCNGMSIVP